MVFKSETVNSSLMVGGAFGAAGGLMTFFDGITRNNRAVEAEKRWEAYRAAYAENNPNNAQMTDAEFNALPFNKDASLAELEIYGGFAALIVSLFCLGIGAVLSSRARRSNSATA